MPTPKTRVELIEEVAIILGPLTPGGALQDTDNVRIGAVITPALEELARDDVVTVSDEDSIENHIFLPLAVYIAEKCGPSYGKAPNEQIMQIAKRDLRIAVRNKPTYEPLAIDYF
jgi:hypothetical protein